MKRATTACCGSIWATGALFCLPCALRQKTDETVAAQFFPLDALPPNRPAHYDETLEDLKKFNGKVILK